MLTLRKIELVLILTLFSEFYFERCKFKRFQMLAIFWTEKLSIFLLGYTCTKWHYELRRRNLILHSVLRQMSSIFFARNPIFKVSLVRPLPRCFITKSSRRKKPLYLGTQPLIPTVTFPSLFYSVIFLTWFLNRTSWSLSRRKNP